MSNPTPIFDAELIFATAIRNALAPVAGTYTQKSITLPNVHWQLPAQGAPRPLLIMAPMTDIIIDAKINNPGAKVDMLIKTQADNIKAARDLLALAAPAMATLTFTGYVVTATYRKSPPTPVTPGGIWQAGHIFHIHITRS